MEEIKRIVEVVADILDCNVKEIQVNGVRPSASFYLVLSIKENYTHKLSGMNEENRLRLTEFNIDSLNVDENTITINSENGNLKPCKIIVIFNFNDKLTDSYILVFILCLL